MVKPRNAWKRTIHLAIMNPWSGGKFLIVCKNAAVNTLERRTSHDFVATVERDKVTCSKCLQPLTDFKAQYEVKR